MKQVVGISRKVRQGCRPALVMAALKYLETQRAAQPELAEWYGSLADLYERKLWHQLTLKLEQFVALAMLQVI